MPPPSNHNLENKTIVVTGGASGIGGASAALFAARGAHVVVADRNAEGAVAVAKAVSGSAHQVDIGSPESIARFAEAVHAEFGPVDGVLACAGAMPGDVLRVEDWDGDWDRFFDVNVRGTYLTALHFGKAMAQRGKGSIVAIASTTGHRSTPLHAYGTSKAAVLQLVRNLSAEWGRSGVRVNSISPGYVLTEGLRASIDKGHRDLRRITDSSAMGRVIEPREIAQAAAFLLSDEASAVTGVDLPVDAGWLVNGSWVFYGGVPAARSPEA